MDVMLSDSQISYPMDFDPKFHYTPGPSEDYFKFELPDGFLQSEGFLPELFSNFEYLSEPNVPKEPKPTTDSLVYNKPCSSQPTPPSSPPSNASGGYSNKSVPKADWFRKVLDGVLTPPQSPPSSSSIAHSSLASSSTSSRGHKRKRLSDLDENGPEYLEWSEKVMANFMIPLPSDAVNYDIICSASLYNDLDLLDATLRNHDSSLHDKESHLTSLHDVDDLGLSFDDYSTDDEKRGSYDIGQPGLVDAFFGLGLPDIDGDLFAVSPVEAFGLTVVQETPKGYFGSSASPSYTADHDHCYSIVTKPSDSEKSQSASVSSESPSEVSSSEEEVDVITIPAEQKEQFLVALPSQEAPTRNTRGRRGRARTRQVMTQIALSKSQKVPVQRIQVRGARSNRQKNSPGSSPSCSDDDDSAKRKEHNYSERQRRRDQQNLLQNLRRCIPELENVPKAPKVRILDCAARYIVAVGSKEGVLRKEKTLLLEKRTELQNKLKKLRAGYLKSRKSIKSSQFL